GGLDAGRRADRRPGSGPRRDDQAAIAILEGEQLAALEAEGRPHHLARLVEQLPDPRVDGPGAEAGERGLLAAVSIELAVGPLELGDVEKREDQAAAAVARIVRRDPRVVEPLVVGAAAIRRPDQLE